ncbi:MAG TPA: PepSY domain-containing protein [Sphingomonas sp.]|nr:PepSY domain-containing protein [Sphingomonas sp.]
MKKIIITAAMIGLGIGCAGMAQAGSPAHAGIGMAKARAIALKVAPGTIKDAEYEKENGGWRYSFDIAQGSRIHEVGVDAFTGKIVENDFEKPGARD